MTITDERLLEIAQKKGWFRRYDDGHWRCVNEDIIRFARAVLAESPMTLPELPEGSVYDKVAHFPEVEKGVQWLVTVCAVNYMVGMFVDAYGPTPRAAAEAALAKIGGKG